MEKLGEEDEPRRSSSAAIRCAKAAMLLSSLNSRIPSAYQFHQREEDLGTEKLAIKLVNLKKTMKKLRFFAVVCLVLYYFLCALILLVFLS